MYTAVENRLNSSHFAVGHVRLGVLPCGSTHLTEETPIKAHLSESLLGISVTYVQEQFTSGAIQPLIPM